MNTLQKIGALVVALAIAFGAGRYLAPPKIQEKIVEKEVIKKQDDIHTVTIITEKPDGTKTTTVVQDDKSKEVTTDDKSSTPTQQQYSARIGIGTAFKGLAPIYMVGVDKKFIGNTSLGAFATTEKMLGVSVGYSF